MLSGHAAAPYIPNTRLVLMYPDIAGIPEIVCHGLWWFAANAPFVEVDWRLINLKVLATDPRTIRTVRISCTKKLKNLCI